MGTSKSTVEKALARRKAKTSGVAPMKLTQNSFYETSYYKDNYKDEVDTSAIDLALERKKNPQKPSSIDTTPKKVTNPSAGSILNNGLKSNNAYDLAIRTKLMNLSTNKKKEEEDKVKSYKSYSPTSNNRPDISYVAENKSRIDEIKDIVKGGGSRQSGKDLENNIKLKEEKTRLERENTRLGKNQADYSNYASLNSPDFQKYSDIGKNFNDSRANVSIKSDSAITLDKTSNTVESKNKEYQSGKMQNFVSDTESVLQMTNEERALYNYYFGKYGKESANNYLAQISEDLKQRAGSKLAQKYNGGEYDNVLKKMGANFNAGLLRGVEGIAQTGNLLMGNDKPVGTSADEYATRAIKANNNAEKIAYGVSNSIGGMAPSIAVSAMTGNPAIGLATFGTGAFGGTYNEEVQRGTPKDEALTYALVNSSLEVGLQAALGGVASLGKGGASKLIGKTSFGKAVTSKIDDVLRAVSKNAKVTNSLRGVGSYALQMNDEGIEEYLQEIIDPVVRNVILDENNEVKAFSKDALYSYLVGAFTAGGMNSTNLISNYSNIASTGQQIKESGELSNIVEQALSIGENTEVGELATKIANTGIKASDYQVGKLYSLVLNNGVQAQPAIQEAIPQEGVQAEIQERTPSNTLSMLTSKGVDQETARVQAKAIDNIVNGTATNSDISVLKTSNTQAREVFTQLTGKDLGTSNTQARDVAREVSQNLEIQPQTSQITKDDNLTIESNQDAKTEDLATVMNTDNVVEVKGIESVKNDISYVKVEVDGETVTMKASDLNFKNEDTKKVYDIASEYKTSGAKAFIGFYNPSIGIENYKKGFNAFYRGAIVGTPVNQISSVYGSMLPNNVQQAIYDSALNDSKAESEVKKATVKKEGSVENNAKKVTETQKKLFETVGKKTGLKIVLHDTLNEGKANGAYIGKKGEIHLSMDSDNVIGTLGHELTHYIKDNSTKYTEYRDFVIKELAGMKNIKVDELIDSYMQRYKNADSSITYSEILDEIVADASESFFTNEEMINKIIAENQTVAEKIIDFLNDLVLAIKEMISGETNNDVAEALKSNLETLEKASDLWVSSFEEATGSKDIVSSDSKFSLKDSEEIAKKAEKELGTTINFKEAGYLTVNGKLLDFSGKKQGGPSGYRSMDHREISDILDLPEDVGYSDGLIEFMRQGNVRMQEFGIDVSVMPNKNQLAVLKRFFDKNNGEITVDFSKLNGDNAGSIDYSEGTKNSKIIADMNRYFETGEVPELSDFDKFRYQLKNTSDIDYDSLVDKNSKLEDANEELARQLTLTKELKPSEKAIETTVNKILKQYNSEYSKETLVENLTNLWNYIANSEEIDGEEVASITTGIAKQILKESKTVDTTMYDMYKDLRNNLRTTAIKISDKDKADLDSVGGYNQFRRDNMGRINLQKEGISVDSLFQELASTYPEFFNAEETTHQAEQLMAMADVIESLQPTTRNDYNMNLDEAASVLAYEIYESYFDIRPLNKTFADKKLKELNQTKYHYKQRISSVRQEYKDRFNDRLKEVKRKGIEKRQEIAEKSKTATEEQRKAYKEQLKKIQDNRIDMLKAQQSKYQDMAKRDRERRYDRSEKKKYKTSILKNVDELSKWLLKPTDKKHVPEGLHGLTASFLKSIDFSSDRMNQYGEATKRTKLWRALEKKYRDIIEGIDKNEDGEQMFMEIDPDFLPRLSEFVAETEDIQKLSDMTGAQMKDLDFLVKIMKHSIQDANKLIGSKNNAMVGEVATKFIDQGNKRKVKKERLGVAKSVDTLLNIDMLNSFNYFEELGEPAVEVFKEIRAGLDRRTENVKIGQDYMKGLLGKTKINEWTGKNAPIEKFEVASGTLELTKAQVMSLYVLNKREQARGHIYGGGIKQEPTIGKEGHKTVIKKTFEPYTIEEEEVNNITSTLSEEEKRIADGIVKFFTSQTSEWGNEVSLTMYGYKKFTEENYFPIVSDSNYIMTKEGTESNELFTLRNMGSTKSTVDNANNPLIIEDIFDVYTRQAEQMANYNALVIPLSDMYKFYNFKIKGEEGKVYGSVKQTIEKIMGSEGKKYFINLMKNINGINEKGIGSNPYEKALSNVKASSVGLNARVIIQQPTSIVRAIAVIDPKYLVKGIAKKGDYEKVKKYAPIAQWKDWGFFEIGTGRQMKDIFLGTHGIEKVKEWSMWGASKADSLTWEKIWNAVEYETLDKKPELKKDSEEFNKAVGERFSEIIDKTQVVDSVLHRSQAMRSQNFALKGSTSFMSESTISYNMLRTSYKRALEEKTTEANNNAIRSTAAFVSSSVAVSAVAAIIDMIRDDDDKKDMKEKYTDSFVENLIDNLNPMGMIPFLKDIVSAFQGFTLDRIETQGIEGVISSGKKWADYKNGESKYNFPYLIQDLASNLGKLFGLPINSVARDIEAITNTTLDMMSNVGFDTTEIEYLKLQYKFDTIGNKSKYAKLLVEARTQGNTALAKQIEKDMLASGIPREKLDSTIKSSVKKAISLDPLVQAGATARSKGDLAGYTKAVKDLVAKGYTEKDAISAITSYSDEMNKSKEPKKTVEPKKDSSYFDEEEGESIYENDMLYDAILSGDAKNALAIRKDLLANGKTEKGIKASITRKIKPLYLDAKKNKEVEKIHNIKLVLDFLGYEQEDIDNWK